MSEAITRVTLFVPGVRIAEKAWAGAPVDVEWVDNDGHFGEAFSFGTVAPDQVAKIDAAAGAHVLHWTVDLRDGRAQIVEVVEKLRAAGALAVRIEQSKVGWDIARWLELFTSEHPGAWHRGAVAFLRGKDALQSCGMHAFSLPDVYIPLDGDPDALHELGSILNIYQLAEDPMLRSGDTFTPDRETPRRVIDRWPDASYPPDHACHNPYGVWRLGGPNSKARPSGKLQPVFMPTLHALLTALEARNGNPLTRKQVEAARDDGACITMEPRDAQKLERSRGYADLDPELVWDQWQLVRRA